MTCNIEGNKEVLRVFNPITALIDEIEDNREVSAVFNPIPVSIDDIKGVTL